VSDDSPSPAHPTPAFAPLVVGALYPSIDRGLKADLLATQALGGSAFPICTSHVVAGDGVVTDVLDVPTDTVSAQLEQVRSTRTPTAAKVSIVGASPTVDVLFRHLSETDVPLLFDVTLSGPSGEDILGQRGLDSVIDHMDEPDLVTVRLTDAKLLAGMEIPSLDDAQVAVQRIAQHGAQRVLLRCGRIPTHHFDTESGPPNYSVDLYYDGDDFALFEAPYLDGLDALHGRSSGYLLPLLYSLQQGSGLEDALQQAKGTVTEALKSAQEAEDDVQASTFFDALHHKPTAPATSNGRQ
jgi:hydroxymethylpyrimidine kinase/phosphomethylpyrimidine kinase